MTDPLVQACIVACALNVSGIGISYYLWSDNRTQRYLQFWALAWGISLIRWLIHYPAESRPRLRATEGLLICAILYLMVLGSYHLIPGKPWKRTALAWTTALIFLAYGIAANAVGLPIELGYSLFAAVLAFAAGCMWVAYRSTRLPGYIFGAVTCLYQLVVVAVMLFTRGPDVANSIVVPLFNLPLILSIVVIAQQRDRRNIMEGERTLQKIFETAPTPIVIVRPNGGEIERANPAAFEMLDISPEAGVGSGAIEHVLIQDPVVRQTVDAELALGRRIHDQETLMRRSGRDERTLSVNADRIALPSGDRYIYSFYDLTNLRRAETELRASAAEVRELYVRFANVEDDERRALHAELHDQVGANLAALRLQLDVAASLLSRNEVSSAQEQLGRARTVAAETIAMARDLMAGLRPVALDDFGLVAALRTLAESQSSRLNLPIDVTGNDLTPRPGRLVESSLFRIAQEAVMNAARHASATRVTVEITAREDRVLLTVRDDGVGFDAEAPRMRQDHWGLKNMRERARAIGGTLHLESTPGSGTRVTADVPREAA